MVKEPVDQELLDLRARFMDSGRSRRSCTIEKKAALKEKTDVKNKSPKKVDNF